MAVKVTPEEFVTKHAARTIAAVPDYRRGVDKVSVAPGVKAAAKADKMLAGVTRAVQSGKWGERVKSVPLDVWQKKCTEVGAGRIEGGVHAAADKALAFATQFLPFVATVQAKVEALPDLTLEDSKRRMLTNMEELSKFKFKR